MVVVVVENSRHRRNRKKCSYLGQQHDGGTRVGPEEAETLPYLLLIKCAKIDEN